jgi:outer membrane murein-binding lipoprotein Lpp
MTRTLVAVVVAVLALAGCVHSENTADGPASASSGATGSTEAAKLTSAEDVNALRMQDYPSGRSRSMTRPATPTIRSAGPTATPPRQTSDPHQ